MRIKGNNRETDVKEPRKAGEERVEKRDKTSVIPAEEHLEDHELIERLRYEDTRSYAFNLLIRKYQTRIYHTVRKMVIDHDDADDLTQDVFVKVWKNLDKFREESQLYTWIYRIAVNECLNFLNKKKRKYFIPVYDVGRELSEKLDSSPGFSGDEIQLKLQKALLKLPDKQRLVFNMKYFEDMKYEEMSEVLGTSVGALKASYHHAVKKIEEYIND